MRKIIVGAIAAGLMLVGAAQPSQAAEPKGEANGYWAGRLCDHVGPTTRGTTYWQSRSYTTRGACVKAEGQSLHEGLWNPATLNPILYPI